MPPRSHGEHAGHAQRPLKERYAKRENDLGQELHTEPLRHNQALLEVQWPIEEQLTLADTFINPLDMDALLSGKWQGGVVRLHNHGVRLHTKI